MNERSGPQVNEETRDLYLNKRATYEPVEGLQFNVTIKNVKYRFGHYDVLIVPDTGSGQRWVLSDNVKLR